MKKTKPEKVVPAPSRYPDPYQWSERDNELLLSDREINKWTGIWKRAQEQMGIPLSAETKAKISLALTGRSLSDTTKAKISVAEGGSASNLGLQFAEAR